MSEATVSSTVDMLGNLLTQEVSFLSGVKDQVEEIKTEFERMQCFLEDADRKSNKEERIRNLIKRVRKVAYRIENVLETYDIKVESKKGKGVKSKLKRCACILVEGVNLHELGVEIGNIKKEIASITPSLETYCTKSKNEGQSSTNDATANLLRQTFAHDIEEDFVGMQDDIDRLVALMTDRDLGHRIISICGMGGLGNTTLAKKVFNHEVVKNHFESFAWVTVSQQFKAENVLKEILKKLGAGRGAGMDFRELVEELHKFQREKKCLVVLDDIWRTEHWNVLRPAFEKTSVDCKVVLTTRIQEVAEIGTPHELKVLSEEDAWQLLKKKAFSNKNGRDSNLEAEQEKLGKEIVHECGYLPLAVSVIGGILRKEETIEGWENVKKNIDSYLRCGRDGFQDNDQVKQILTLSYDDLPYQLKPCLLYLAYYPEDAEIDLQQLYWMWIAEGLILSKDKRDGTESLMEVAKRYLNALASRSLVQVQLNDELSTSKSCCLHDLIHDLCVRKCEEEDFLRVIDLRKSEQQKYYLNSPGRNAYRLVIYGSEDDGTVYNEILKKANRGARAFSLRNFDYNSPLSISSKMLEDLGNLKFLKVLDKVIRILIHLRCLSFVNCKLKKVPSSVGELSYLQTFYLSNDYGEVLSPKKKKKKDYGEVKIPNVFGKLKRLLHFVVLGDGLVISPCELEWEFYSGLETLIIYNYSHPAIKDLSKLTNLRVFKLCVSDSKNLSLIIHFLKSERHRYRDTTLRIVEGHTSGGCDFIGTVDGPTLLCELFLCHAIQHLEISSVRINELPKYESGMLSDLVDLKLWRNEIREDPLPTLEKLPKLKLLCLEYNSFVGEEFNCSSTGFPHLKKLVLQSLPNLKIWRIDDGAMPILSTVTIDSCKKLEMIPTGMKFLKALRNLKTQFMPKEFNNRICIVDGAEGADLYKVRHVPSINICEEEISPNYCDGSGEGNSGEEEKNEGDSCA